MEQTVDRQSSPNALVRAYPWIATLLGVIVLAQALMAGRFIYLGDDLLDVHGRVGDLTFLVVIVLVIGAWLGRQAKVMTNTELALSGALFILVVTQLGLGYSDGSTPTAWHVANGALIAGVSFALITISFVRQPTRS